MRKKIAFHLILFLVSAALFFTDAAAQDLNLANQPLGGYYQAAGNITADNCWIKPGDYAWLVAGATITLKPGFQAKLGSEFGIVIGGYGDLPQNLDYDNDKLFDWWELTYFGALNQDRYGDYDGDGAINFLEHQCNSNPADAGSKPPSGIYYEYDSVGRIKRIMRIP